MGFFVAFKSILAWYTQEVASCSRQRLIYCGLVQLWPNSCSMVAVPALGYRLQSSQLCDLCSAVLLGWLGFLDGWHGLSST